MKLFRAATAELTLVILLTGSTGATVAQQPATAADAVDFHSEIRPLLETHCVSCHGPDLAAGGLRLDSREAAQEGGGSQRPVLGGRPEDNELFRRVSSTDPHIRMPKAAPALPPQQVRLIERWIESGSPWPDPVVEPEPSLSLVDRLAAVADWFDVQTQQIPGFQVFLAVALAIGAFILLVEQQKKRLAGRDQAGRHIAWVTHTGWSHYCLLCGCWIGALAGLYLLSQLERAEASLVETKEDLSQLKQQLKRYTGEGTFSEIYGTPPIPRRPGHPKALSHTYYRGNCERSERLFNGGNYRTATLRISLRNEDGRQVEYEESVAGQKLFIRFELIRAPKTAEVFFKPEVMRSVFLSKDVYDDKHDKLQDEVTRLTTVRENQEWKAEFAIGDPGSSGRKTGMVYVYQNLGQKGLVRATPHFGIRYTLHIVDGRLTEKSELWMGSLFATPAIGPPPPMRPAVNGKVPFEQWFSEYPIPEITGENTKDPDLLGIPEDAR